VTTGPTVRVELYAAIRRDARAGLSGRALKRKHGVGYATVAAALESAWLEPRKKQERRDSGLDPYREVIDGWLRADLDAAMGNDDGKSVELDEVRAFALWQVLRATEMMRPSTLHALAERLRQRYGYPPYPAASLRRWTPAA
jgi:hypothetical protein